MSLRLSLHIAVAVAIYSVALAVKDVSINAIDGLKPPAVVLFYNGSGSSAGTAALIEFANIEASNEDFKFYKVDVTEDEDAAKQAGVTDGTHLFSYTADTGIEEIHLPIRKLFVNRYLSFLKLVPAPDSVVSIKSEAALSRLTERSDTMPVFVMFYEAWCSHCYKAKRIFEQGAGFFANFITFAKVDCGSGSSARALCSARNITNVPTFVLFTKPLVVTYEGGRSVAEFEVFFQNQKTRRKQVENDGEIDAFFSGERTLPAPGNSATSDSKVMAEELGVQADSTLQFLTPDVVVPSTSSCEAEINSLRSELRDLKARLQALEDSVKELKKE